MTTQNEEFDFDRPFTQAPRDDDDLDFSPQEPALEDDLPLEDPEGARIEERATLVNSSTQRAGIVSLDGLYRDRRADEIELAHVEEDLDNRLIFLVCQLPDRVWPGKNEEARSISKAATRASDPVCKDLDRRRRVLEAELSAVKGEIEAREALDAQRRMAQKDLELDFTRQDLALRSRFADLDAQLRAAELIVSNREVNEAMKAKEREERVKLVATYLK